MKTIFNLIILFSLTTGILNAQEFSYEITDLTVSFIGPEVSCDYDSWIYSWDFGDGETYVTSCDAYATHTYAEDGDYEVCLTMNDSYDTIGPNCETLTVTNGVASISSENISSFAIYPNPVINELNISNSTEIKEVTIYNNLGKLVLNTSESKINIENLKLGLYICKVENLHGDIELIKFVKE